MVTTALGCCGLRRWGTLTDTWLHCAFDSLPASEVIAHSLAYAKEGAELKRRLGDDPAPLRPQPLRP